MKIPIYQVDAFTDQRFGGNPAAVCVLDQPLDEPQMQAIAMENNLSETAFVYRGEQDYTIRWFTPASEVALCGHATLASAFVLWNQIGATEKQIVFNTRHRGPLLVRRLDDESIQLDLPADQVEGIDPPTDVIEALGEEPISAFQGETDLMLVFDSEFEIRSIEPHFRQLADWPYRGVIVTARGEKEDFVSRFFGPRVGVDEDPVTGSAHCTLIPYWSGVLEKEWLVARQLSQRSGLVTGAVRGDRVLLNGRAVLYLSGSIIL